MGVLFQVLLELCMVREVAADFIMGLVTRKSKCSLCLFAILVHKNLLLVIESHADVGIINFLVLGHILQEMLVFSLRCARADFALEVSEFSVQLCCHVNITDNFAWVKDRASSFLLVQFECWLCNLAERCVSTSWLQCIERFFTYNWAFAV